MINDSMKSGSRFRGGPDGRHNYWGLLESPEEPPATAKAVDFSVMERFEVHSYPGCVELKVDLSGFHPAEFNLISAICNGEYTSAASTGQLKEALQLIDNLEEEVKQAVATNGLLRQQLGGISLSELDILIMEMRRVAVAVAEFYLVSSSPLDKPTFQQCAQELLVEAPFCQAELELCTRAELQHWSNDLSPDRIFLSLSHLQRELEPHGYSSKLNLVLEYTIISHCFRKELMPFVSEKQFQRWSRVVKSIYIAELEQEFALSLKTEEDGRHRLVLDPI